MSKLAGVKTEAAMFPIRATLKIVYALCRITQKCNFNGHNFMLKRINIQLLSILFVVIFTASITYGVTDICTIAVNGKVPTSTGKVTIYIYSPESVLNPQSTVKYPVVYLLHCFGGNAYDWERYSQISSLIDNHKFIAVALDDGDGNNWWLDSPIKPNCKLSSFLCNEVRSYVRNFISTKYRKTIYTNINNTALMGFSMGGFGAFYNSINLPGKNIFGIAIGNNACVNLHNFENAPDNDEIKSSILSILGPVSSWSAYDIDDNVARFSKSHKYRFYNFKASFNSSTGNFDDEWFYADNMRLSRNLSESSIIHEYFVVETQAGHLYPNIEIMNSMMCYLDDTFAFDKTTFNTNYDKYTAFHRHFIISGMNED